ncbi:MAG: hypothetical protein GF364_04355 [Candidatus Lokiarchaeota archaeon]|nr:hypothetical protein [Candidatus Lokiarchaeota archaeon]
MSAKTKNVLVIGVDQAILGLIKQYIDEGILPNIKSMVDNGVLLEGLSTPPCDTPTNWATIATGAPTGVHGATSFYMHIPGEPLEKGLNYRSRTQLKKYAKAEYMWEVADRHELNPFVINYPAGWPTKMENGAMSLYKWSIPESLPRNYKRAKIRTYTVKKEQLKDNQSWLLINTSPKTDSELDQKLRKLVSNDSVDPLEILLIDPVLALESAMPKAYILKENGKYNTIAVKLDNNEWETLALNQWSGWISVILKSKDIFLPCIFRIMPQSINEDGKTVKIKFSTIYNTKGWAYPEGIGELLIKNAFAEELTLETPEVEYLIEGDVEDFLIEAKKESDALAHAITYMKDKIDWHVCFFHIHYLDSVNHYFLSYLYEDSPLRKEDPELAAVAEKNVRVAYQIVDDMVGQLLRSCVDDDTTVVFTADHGAIPVWKNINIPKALSDAGLMHYKLEGNQYIVDWNKTKVFPYLEPPYIWVNMQGRDPKGIVPQSEYDDVCQQVIQALEGMKDHETGERILRAAFTRDEAAFLGQKGDRVGDVIFFLNPPYQVFDGSPNQLNAYKQSKALFNILNGAPSNICLGAHAYYLPTTKLGKFSVSCPVIFSGAGIKKGVESDIPINLTDISPTLCHLLGIPKPKDARGRVLQEILNN